MRSSSFSFFVSSPPCVILSEAKACPEPCRRESRIFLNAKARQRKYCHRRTPTRLFPFNFAQDLCSAQPSLWRDARIFSRTRDDTKCQSLGVGWYVDALPELLSGKSPGREGLHSMRVSFHPPVSNVRLRTS